MGAGAGTGARKQIYSSLPAWPEEPEEGEETRSRVGAGAKQLAGWSLLASLNQPLPGQPLSACHADKEI